MAIVFHCDHCGKKIEAADSAGGKWGKCPACHNKLYVPAPPSDEDEELRLAPLDDEEEQRKRQLMAETYQLTHDILDERIVPEGPPPVASAGHLSAAVPARNINEKDLTKHVIMYLRLMADGDLEKAQQTVAAMAPDRSHALEIIDRIALSDMPEPELADIPPQVLSGLIRTLRVKLT